MKKATGSICLVILLLVGCALMSTPFMRVTTSIGARHLGEWLAEHDQETASTVVETAVEVINFIGYGDRGEGIQDKGAQTQLQRLVERFLDEVKAGVTDPMMLADLRDLQVVLLEAVAVNKKTLTIAEEHVTVILQLMESFKEGVEIGSGRLGDRRRWIEYGDVTCRL